MLFLHLSETLLNLRECHVFGSPSRPYAEIIHLNLHILVKNDARKDSIVYLTTDTFKIVQRHSKATYISEFMIRTTIKLFLKFKENSKNF